MGWSSTCYTLPRIKNHAEAEAFFNGVGPLRSSIWGTHERPLGRRPAHNKRIVRREIGDGSYCYDLVLYSTALVTYEPDGRVFVTRYDTKMSRDFLDAVLPIGLSTVSHSDMTMVRANTPDGPAWYFGGKSALEFEPCGHNWWRLNSTPQARVRQSMDLKRAAQIRKAAKPFLTWVAAHRALIGTSQFNRTALSRPPASESLEQLQNVEAWPDIEPYIGDRTEWMQMLYDALGARTEHLISDHEPPKRGRSHFYS